MAPDGNVAKVMALRFSGRLMVAIATRSSAYPNTVRASRLNREPRTTRKYSGRMQ
jgi:hypothetical protein